LNTSAVLLASGRAHADAHRWSEAYESYTQATQVLPKYYLVWLERGRLNTKLGRWKSAAGDFAAAVTMGCPPDQGELSGVAQLLFFGGEMAAYEQLCEAFRASVQKDPLSAAIRGQLAGEISQTAAVELADRVERILATSRQAKVARSAEGTLEKQHKFEDMFYGANLYVAGWAHLKAGHNESAVERLQESNDANWFGRGIAYPLIAIAHHRLGNGDEALRAFEHSQAFLDRQLDECVSQVKGAPSIPWVDWIEFQMHHRNASVVVKGHTPAADVRVQQMDSFAEAAIAE
jgi:tetratricopeptide (TPR) repeat protein